MPDATSPIRRTARVKLSAGVRAEVVVENLVRKGWPREEAVGAFAAEVEALKKVSRKEFKFIHTRRSLADRMAAGAVPMLAGLGIMACGVGLSVLVSSLTFGSLWVVFIGLIATGFVVMLYGIAGGGD